MKNRIFKKCLITGITGSGGSYLAEYIKKKDKKIKIIGTTRKKNSKICKNLKKISKIKQLNLLNFLKLKKFLINSKPDLIFHIASYADVENHFFKIKVINNNNKITKFT